MRNWSRLKKLCKEDWFLKLKLGFKLLFTHTMAANINVRFQNKTSYMLMYILWCTWHNGETGRVAFWQVTPLTCYAWSKCQKSNPPNSGTCNPKIQKQVSRNPPFYQTPEILTPTDSVKQCAVWFCIRVESELKGGGAIRHHGHPDQNKHLSHRQPAHKSPLLTFSSAFWGNL